MSTLLAKDLLIIKKMRPCSSVLIVTLRFHTRSDLGSSPCQGRLLISVWHCIIPLFVNCSVNSVMVLVLGVCAHVCGHLFVFMTGAVFVVVREHCTEII